MQELKHTKIRTGCPRRAAKRCETWLVKKKTRAPNNRPVVLKGLGRRNVAPTIRLPLGHRRKRHGERKNARSGSAQKGGEASVAERSPAVRNFSNKRASFYAQGQELAEDRRAESYS